MDSKYSDFKRTKHNNSIEKLTENVDINIGDISWLSDSLPVAVFRTSSKLS
jgi:hypothetical protein